jgi:hypothetical protein
MPESSIAILGHSVGGITYPHYAHRAPLAFKAIMTLPQPMAFTSLAKGFDGECPCCRREFSGPDSWGDETDASKTGVIFLPQSSRYFPFEALAQRTNGAYCSSRRLPRMNPWNLTAFAATCCSWPA